MRKIDLTGQRFGRLVVIDQAPSDKAGHTCWNCLCDCGRKTVVAGIKLKSGQIVSCGCKRDESRIRHGKYHTRLYTIWGNMKQRCGNPRNTSFRRYGGRGIKVCQEWANSFEAFYKWAMAHGYADNLQIDRIDNDGDYTPDNCRWIPQSENLNHTSRNVFITIDGDKKTVAEWAKITGVNEKTIRNRLKAGKSPEDAIK